MVDALPKGFVAILCLSISFIPTAVQAHEDDEAVERLRAQLEVLAQAERPIFSRCEFLSDIHWLLTRGLNSSDDSGLCDGGGAQRTEALALQVMKRARLQLRLGLEVHYDPNKKALVVTFRPLEYCKNLGDNLFTAEPRLADEGSLRQMVGSFYALELPMAESAARASPLWTMPDMIKASAWVQVEKLGCKKRSGYSPTGWVVTNYGVLKILGVQLLDDLDRPLVATGEYASPTAPPPPTQAVPPVASTVMTQPATPATQVAAQIAPVAAAPAQPVGATAAPKAPTKVTAPVVAAKPASPSAASAPAAVKDTLSRDDVLNVIRANLHEALACIQDYALKHNAAHIPPKIMLKWIIHPDGQTDEQGLGNAELRGQSVEKCVSEAIKHWTFPPYKEDEDIPVSYPVSLSQ